MAKKEIPKMTLINFLERIRDNPDKIAIRENLGNGWKSYFLTELPLKNIMNWIIDFIKSRELE